MFLGVLESPNNILIRFFDRSKKYYFFVKWELFFGRRCQTIEPLYKNSVLEHFAKRITVCSLLFTTEFRFLLIKRYFLILSL